MVTDRLRTPPATSHLTGETRKGDAINTLFDQMPEDTKMYLTLVVTPQDMREAHLNHLSKKAVGEALASEQTRKDVQQARSLVGSSHKLYRASLAFYLRWLPMNRWEPTSSAVSWANGKSPATPPLDRGNFCGQNAL